MVGRDLLQDEGYSGADKVVDLFLQSSHHKVKEIDLDRISPRSDQPRKEFEDIEELAESIKERGVIQPIRVKPAERPGHYDIIAGERRWRASRIAGKRTIPCIVVDGLSRVEVMLDALIENIQRRDLTAFEKAMAIKDLIEESIKTTGKALTLEEVGKRLGYGKSRVSQLLSILSLPMEIKQAFCESGLNEMHARGLMALKKHPQGQKQLFKEIKIKKLTGQQAMDWANRYLAAIPAKTKISKMAGSWKKSFNSFHDGEFKNMGKAERQAVIQEMEDFISEVRQILKKIKELD
ncbi:MAG: ParB/RepB/Spo0J family partition protein [Bacillota bacterium]